MAMDAEDLVVREALEMIEDMGAELSLSLSVSSDEAEEDVHAVESSRGAQGGADGRQPGKRPSPSRPLGPAGSQPRKRKKGSHRSHQTLRRALLALDGGSEGESTDVEDDPIEQAGASDEDLARERARGLWSPEAPSFAASVDSERSERTGFAPPDASAAHHVVGPQLRALREGQGTNREYYTHEHLRRLRECEARVPWNRLGRGSKTYCSKAHRQPCKACTTCHFCRQKTTDQKTWCPCSLKKGRIVGGKSRGILCGFCLEMRFGENLDEALSNPSWRCPACRDICNCSGATCSRSRRNLFPTNQLYHEADSLGYKSVAHYLILTHLTDGEAMPMPEVGRGSRPRKPTAEAAAGAGEEGDEGDEGGRALLRRRAKIALRREIEVLRIEFPPPDGWEDLGLTDPQEEEEEEEQEEEQEEREVVEILEREGEAAKSAPMAPVAARGVRTEGRGAEDAQVGGELGQFSGSLVAAAVVSRGTGAGAPRVKGSHRTRHRHRQQSAPSIAAPSIAAPSIAAPSTAAPTEASALAPRGVGAVEEPVPAAVEEIERWQGRAVEAEAEALESRRREVQRRKDEVFSLSLKALRVAADPEDAAAAGGPWHEMLKQVQAVDWESLTVPQRNQRASPIVARLPTRAVVAADGACREVGGKESASMTHDELRVCSSVLLVLASVLPERQLVPMVCKKVFGRAPIVDVGRSDTRARAILFDASFKILRIMHRRGVDLSQALELLVGVCRSLLDAQDSLFAALSAKVGLGTTPGIRVGSLDLPAVTNRFGQLERISLVRSAMEANQELLLNALSHFAALSTACGRVFHSVLGGLVSRMVDAGGQHLNGLRGGALGFAYAALVLLRAGATEGREEAVDALAEALLPKIDGLVNTGYPIRSKDAGGASADAGAEDSVGIAVSEDTLTMAVRLLCEVVAFLLCEGKITWERASAIVHQPYSPQQFWSSANAHYRSLAYKLTSSIASGTAGPCFKQRESLLGAWIVCMVDPSRGRHQVQVTDALVTALGLGKADLPSAPSEIRSDRDGTLRASWVGFVLRGICSDPRLPSALVSFQTIKTACDFFLAAQKEVVGSGGGRQGWERAALNVLAALLGGYLELKRGDGPALAGAGPLLDLLSRTAAGNLGGCLDLFLRSESKGPNPRLGTIESLGSARMQIRGSPLVHLKSVVEAAASIVVKDGRVWAPSRGLHDVLVAAFELVPGTGPAREPFMTALYEEISSALCPPADASSGGGGGGGRDALSHFVLGTYVRRWLQRAAAAPRQHTGVAVGALCFLRAHFTQAALRSSPALLRLHLPPLLGPLVECLCLGESCDASSPLQLATLLKHSFGLLCGLARSCGHLVPEYHTAESLGKSSFPCDMNALSSPDPMEEGKHECCLGILWHSALQCFLRLVANALNANLRTIDQVNAASQEQGHIAVLTANISATNRGRMFRLLGRPRPLGGVEALYAQSSRPASALSKVDTGRYPQQLCSLADLVSSGFAMASALQGSDRGLRWALALLPPLHSLLRLAETRPRQLDGEYVLLWSALDAKGHGSGLDLPARPVEPALAGSPVPIQLGEEGGTQAYPNTQDTVRYPSQPESQATGGSGAGTGQPKPRIVSTRDLGGHVGGVVNFFGYVRSRDPERGTKAFKSQKDFSCVTMADRQGSVKLILTGAAAKAAAAQLDEHSMRSPGEEQIVVVKGARVFRRKDGGQVLLQGLQSTRLMLNPSVKAVGALRAWIRERRGEGEPKKEIRVKVEGERAAGAGGGRPRALSEHNK